jgi:murein DD-endopeptidase / murein LD-carboxypeptidase
MMKIFFETKGKFFILLVSKQLYPELSFQNIESQAEKKKLKDFMDAGTEKWINTHNTSANEIIETAQKYFGVPHNSEEQARYGKIIAGMDELLKGDLVFFIRTYKTHHFITHSGIYIGNNKFIHTSSKNGVTITSLNDPWWNEKFIFGTRVFD